MPIESPLPQTSHLCWGWMWQWCCCYIPGYITADPYILLASAQWWYYAQLRPKLIGSNKPNCHYNVHYLPSAVYETYYMQHVTFMLQD